MGQTMTSKDYASKQAELDRQLNDPEITLEPARIWALLEELANYSSKELDNQSTTDCFVEPQAGTRGYLPAR